MPWNNQSGGGSNGNGPGPWGRGPTGGGNGSGNPPPDLEELLRRGQDNLRRLVPGPGFSFNMLGVFGLLALVVWLASGVYFVNPEEEGIVLRFGQVTARTNPGPNYHLPWPIETVYTPNVTQENQIPIGYTPSESSDTTTAGDDIEEESHMLTGDENIVDVNFAVYWKIKDAVSFIFNVDHPKDTIKAVAESAMRQVVGENGIEGIQTSQREQMQMQVRDLMQKAVDSYKMGVTITRVQLIRADPPQQVIAAYRDVQAARADQQKKRNEAEEYANKIIPEARGQAAQIVQDAQAYKAQVIAVAAGDAARFNSVYQEYKKAPDVTRRRIYLETMAGILGPMNKVIVDEGAAKGFVPYFPMPGQNSTRTPIQPIPQTGDQPQEKGQ